MLNYLVSGGLGFIGSHLVGLLLEHAGAHVTVVDNRQGHVFSLEYLRKELTDAKPGVLGICVENIADYRPDKNFDVIYHLASVVGPKAVLDYSGYITESIVRDTYAVIRLARQHGARLVNVSTSEVYGGGDHGLCEEETPCVIRGCASARQEYAAGKLACEVSVSNLCRDADLNAVTIRPFNVSGVRQLGGGGFVLPRLVGQAVLGIPLTVFGDGKQVRAFTDVRDVAEGIRIAGNAGERGAAYNVGNPENRTTILELAQLVLHVTHSSSTIQFIDPKALYGIRYEEAADKFPDAARLLKLGWRPQFKLSDTVLAVFASFSKMSATQLRAVAGLE